MTGNYPQKPARVKTGRLNRRYMQMNTGPQKPVVVVWHQSEDWRLS
jgi:hypothetical protein